MIHEPFTFTSAALREIDRRAVEEFHIPLLILMENAGRAVAHSALQHLKANAAILVVAGPGNNGADGLVAARHLHNAGHPLQILTLFDPHAVRSDSPLAAQMAIITAMQLPLHPISTDHAEVRDWIVDSQPHDLIIDGLFGTGLSREVTGLARDVIHALNPSRRVILSIDIPSGLDADTGVPLGDRATAAAIKARETISFCGHKPGFSHPAAKAYTGKITVADIGVPHELVRELANQAPPI